MKIGSLAHNVFCEWLYDQGFEYNGCTFRHNLILPHHAYKFFALEVFLDAWTIYVAVQIFNTSREYKSFTTNDVIHDISALGAYIQSVRDKYSIDTFKITALCAGMNLSGFAFNQHFDDYRFQTFRYSKSTGLRAQFYYSGSSIRVVVYDEHDKDLFHHKLDGLEITFALKLLNHLSEVEG